MFNMMRMSNGRIANYDDVAQIHYGAISINSVSPDALDWGGNGWTDETCKFQAMEQGENEDEFNDDYMPHGDTDLSFDDGEYQFITVLDNCLLILKSPYYTYARYCSPCLPNAGDLDSTSGHGIKTYCLGEDFFDEDSPCPYPIFKVGEEITQ